MMKRLFAAVTLACVVACVIAFGTLWPVGAQNTTTFGNISAGGAGCGGANCVFYQLPPGTPWVVITVTGSWSGSLQVSTISAPNANYSNLNTVPWLNMATETGNGTWSASVTGATFLLVTATSWTSGTAVVTMNASQSQGPIINAILPGTITANGFLGGSQNFVNMNVSGTATGGNYVGGVNGGLATQQTGSGLKQDARLCQDLAVTQNSPNITSTCGNFKAADVGKLIVVYPANGARTYTGTIASVSSSTAAALSSNYLAANATGATMIVGSDDGAAFNSMVTSNVPGSSTRGTLDLGCKPIMTSIPLVITGGRSLELKGCSLNSGILANLASGSAYGSVIIWAGSATPVSSISESGNTVTVNTASALYFQAAGCSLTKLCEIDVEGNTQAGYDGTHLILSVPSSTQVTYYAAATLLTTENNAGYIPTQDVIQIVSSYGVRIHDISFMGSDQASTKPRSLIDLMDGGGTGPSPVSLNKLYNLYGGNLVAVGMGNLPGNTALSTSTAEFGILADPAAYQDDRNQVDNVSFYGVDACFASESTTQPVDWNFDGVLGCGFSGDGFLLLGGTQWNVPGTYEGLGNSHDFILGSGARLKIGRYSMETDANATLNGIQLNGPGDVAGTSMMAEMYGIPSLGVPAGVLQIGSGTYFPNGALPSSGAFIWTNGVGATLLLDGLVMGGGGGLFPPTVTPVIDLRNSGINTTTVELNGSFGPTKQNFLLPSTCSSQNHIVVIENDDPFSGSGTFPVHGRNVLACTDTIGYDDFRYDMEAKPRFMSGNVNVPQVAPPQATSASCATAGSTTYYVKLTAMSGGLETNVYNEAAVTSCSATVSGTNTITLGFTGAIGADSYKEYRTVAGGGTGTEHYVQTIQANTSPGQVQMYVGAGKIVDSTPDGSLGAATPPTVNSTGQVQAYYILPVLSTVTLGNACPVNGVVWLGLDRTAGQCESNVLVAWPTASYAAATSYAYGAGAGTSPSLLGCSTANGEAPCSTNSGLITWKTGTSPAIGTQFTVTIPTQAKTPNCVITPVGALAGGLQLNFAGGSTSTFSVAATIAPAASTQYFATYHCDSQ